MDSYADANMQDLVENITGVLQQGKPIAPPLDLPDGIHEEYAGLVSVVQGLHETLVPVEPSAGFAVHLKTQLLDSQPGVMARLRQMPARVHFAAILAVFAGFGLLLTRRLFGSSDAQDITEETVATAL